MQRHSGPAIKLQRRGKACERAHWETIAGLDSAQFSILPKESCEEAGNAVEETDERECVNAPR